MEPVKSLKPSIQQALPVEPEISAVLPCLNEAETLEACIREIQSTFERANILGEILVADNGSTDGSQEIARRLGAKVVEVKDKGYGSALMGGFRQARGKYIVMGDSDSSYDFTAIPQLLEKLRGGAELVMGCRLPSHGGRIMPGAMPWLHRYLGNPVLSKFGKLFFGVPVNDFHCGIRAFDRDRLLELNLQTPGMEFASEMIVKSALVNLRIDEVPVTLRKDGRSRAPHLRTWRDGWRHLRLMLIYAPNWLFVYPGMILFALGLFGTVALIPSELTIRGVNFDTNTLIVSSTCMLIGFLAVIFGVFAKTYGAISGLLPFGPVARYAVSSQPFEFGIITGLGSMLLGLSYLAYAFFQWRETGFGDLSYPDSLRIVVPAVTLMSLGAEAIFGGFLLAVLTIHVNRDKIEADSLSEFNAPGERRSGDR